MDRGAGVLLHVTSLSSGDFSSATKFIDFLHDAKVKYWQVLAFGPTGYGDSPYSPLSVFAINPKFLGGAKKTYPDAEVKKFITEHKFWIEPFATYMVLKDVYGGKDWMNWDKAHQDFNNPAVKEFMTMSQKEITKHIQTQMNLFEQWYEIKRYANDRGVQIVGDLPIYTAMDSADVWAYKNQFEFENGKPTAVAGVGPDYFNADGQLWGNPLYDFKQMQKDKFKWWSIRMKLMCDMFDVVRIDHFRAFDSYYKIPYGSSTAKNGTWVKGPGIKFFNAMDKVLNNPQIILEDLGDITQSVEALRDQTGYPGMRVMQFGFDGKDTNIHLPTNYSYNSVAYIGTHDNDTFMGWLKSLGKKDRAYVNDYLSSHGLGDKDVTRLAIEDILKSKSNIAVITMQDLLFQDSKSRMNVPGKAGGNWKYKITPIDLTKDLSYYVSLLVERSNRR